MRPSVSRRNRGTRVVGAVTVALSTSALAATGALAARLQQPAAKIAQTEAGVPVANQGGAAPATKRADRSGRQPPARQPAPARGPILPRTTAAAANQAPASAPGTTAAAPRGTTIAPPPRTPTAPPPTKATTPPPPPPTSSGGS